MTGSNPVRSTSDLQSSTLISEVLKHRDTLLSHSSRMIAV